MTNYVCGNTCFASDASRLTADQSVSLSKLEVKLAHILFTDERVIARTELMDRLYDLPDPPFDKAIDYLMRRFRKKLARIGSNVVIESRYGVGWRILRPQCTAQT